MNNNNILPKKTSQFFLSMSLLFLTDFIKENVHLKECAVSKKPSMLNKESKQFCKQMPLFPISS